MSDLTPALVVSNLYKKFGSLEILKGISVTARKGGVLSMLGASGSGKSTFLRCVNLLEIPNAGTISVHGETIEMIIDKNGIFKPKDRRQVARIRARLGMVFQNFNLWSHMTIIQNVIEAPIHVLKQNKNEAVAKAEYILNKVGLYDHKDYYPAHASGGQQQRAAIARALAMDPDVLLFDEPTSSLDPELVGEVLGVMHDLAAEGRTMIVVTHEIGFARDVSSEVIFLHDGLIEEQGLPGEVLTKPGSKRLEQFLSKYIH